MSLHHSTKTGQVGLRTPALELLLSKKGSYPDQIIDRFLFKPCLDFLDSLWTNQGSFYGHWADHHLDAEYTFYGLLALGHLA